METNPKLAALYPEERRLVQSWLAEFERDWGEGKLPAPAAEWHRWPTRNGPPAQPLQPAPATAARPAARETVKAEAAKATQGQKPSTVGDAPGTQRPLPEQFGRYRILKKLGAGGMGT